MDAQSIQQVDVRWATHGAYPSRAHMTNGRGLVSLCGFPISTVLAERPKRLAICPDCATAFVDVSFPARAGRDRCEPAYEWFRQLGSR